MRKLLNTLYITNSQTDLSKVGETVLVMRKEEKVMQVPIHNIEGIVIFTPGKITPQLIELCAERNVHISMISYSGRFICRIQNPVSGNVVLRRQHYRLTDNKESKLGVAKNFVLGKVFNCRCILQRLLRDHAKCVDSNSIKVVISHLNQSLKRIEKIDNIDSLRGMEGDAAKMYFSVFNEFILDKNSGFVFNGRSRRPPLDEVNALLSFFYTILAHEVEAALETVGLDPQVGFLHEERSGRYSLALDMMEELRPYLVDRFVITMINNKQVNINDFVKKESGAIFLKDEAKKKVIAAWQTRKMDEITHPFLKERIEVGVIMYSQALLLARFIRGDLDGYPVFMMR